MKRIIFSNAIIFLCSFAAIAQPEWLRGYGDENLTSYSAVDIDADGNVYMAGGFTNAITLDGLTVTGDDNDLFIAKFNNAGDIQWLKSEQAVGRYILYDLQLSYDGGFVLCGSFNNGNVSFGDIDLTYSDQGNYFIAKYDLGGNIQWAKSEIGNGTFSNLTIDNNNNIIVAGYYYDMFTFNGDAQPAYGDYDVFYAKYNASGEALWIKSFGGTGSDDIGVLTTDVDNNIIITGRFGTTFSVDGFNFNDYGLGDAFVLKANHLGEIIWVNIIGSINNDNEPAGIVSAADGNLYMCMQVINETYVDAFEINTLAEGDVCLFQINADNGAVNWFKTGGGYGNEYPEAMAIGKEGIFITGTYSEAAEFDGLQLPATFSGGFIVSYNYAGEATEVVALTGDNFVSPRSILTDKHGNLYCSGIFYEDVIVDGLPSINTTDNPNIFMFKMGSPLVSIEQINLTAKVHIYPNPANQFITLTTDLNSANSLAIYASDGTLMFTLAELNGELEISIADYAAGIYFVKILGTNGVIATQSFIKI